jgi:hypothetical protein
MWRAVGIALAVRPESVTREKNKYSDGSRPIRSGKDSLAAPPEGAKGGKSEDPRPGSWHVSACQWVGG